MNSLDPALAWRALAAAAVLRDRMDVGERLTSEHRHLSSIYLRS